MALFDTDDAISEMLRVARRAPQTGLRVLLRQFEPVQFAGQSLYPFDAADSNEGGMPIAGRTPGMAIRDTGNH